MKAKWLKVVGWGPCPLPGERARLARAHQRAEQLLEALKEIETREINMGGKNGSEM